MLGLIHRLITSSKFKFNYNLIAVIIIKANIVRLTK